MEQRRSLSLENLRAFRYLKATFLTSYDHLPTLFTFVLTLEEFILLQELDLA